MLEEALKDPSRHPAETAQAMRVFISQDLPIGGSSAEDRFLKLFPLLCTRVFGEMQDIKGEFKHEPGGWLSAQTRWRPTASSTQHHSSRVVSAGRPVTPSIEADPVVQLLGHVQKLPAKTGAKNTNETHYRSIIEALTTEVEKRPGVLFQFPFLSLPVPLQKQYMLALEAVMVGSTSNNNHHHQMNLMLDMNGDRTKEPVAMSQNSYRLFTGLMRCGPEVQQQVSAYQQKKLHEKNLAQPLQLSPGLASPQNLAPISPTMTSPMLEQKENTTNLIVSMLEFYLFLFIRYPLASPFIPRQSSSQPGVNRYQASRPMSRGTTPYGETIYCNLFSRYLRHFLPHTAYPTAEAEFPQSKAASEFFLRVVISFWLESRVSIPTTGKAVQSIRERFQRTGIQHAPSVDLKMSYDLAVGTYTPLPSLAIKCLRSLTIHSLLDPTIFFSVMDQNSGNRHWCLSQAMTALQQPFFNHVRASFRHASIHSQGSAFYSAMNAWLMWLEPWNVNQSKAASASSRLMNSIPGKAVQTPAGPTLTIPKADKKSGYTSSWEPYLAANLFLYTVPLAIFLRRARELDFSPREFYRSMDVLKRVFRVYTPEVIQALTNLTAAINNPAPGGSNFSKTVENHRALLGDYAPSTMGDLSLASCQNDMQGLLEEMHMQHMKRVRDLGYLDKFGAYLEGLFGHGVVSGEEIAIKSLVEKARVIVGFPIGYEILSSDASGGSSGRGAGAAAASQNELRTSQGVLTDEGRQMLLAGRYKCSPADVHYVGDKMQSRLRSHELAILVTLTTYFSQWLNEKCGLLPPQSIDISASPMNKRERFQENLEEQGSIKGWRINLRWFADYRNLLFAVVVTLMVSTIILR